MNAIGDAANLWSTPRN